MKTTNCLFILLVLCLLSLEVFGQASGVFEQNNEFTQGVPASELKTKNTPYNVNKTCVFTECIESFACISRIIDCFYRRIFGAVDPHLSQPPALVTIINGPLYGTASITGNMWEYSPDTSNPSTDFIVIQNCSSSYCEIVTIDFTLSYIECIPTLSEWKKAILSLLLLSFGILGIQKITYRQVIQLSLNEPRRSSFCFLGAWLGILLLVLVFYQEILLRDVLMGLLAAVPVSLIALVYSRQVEKELPDFPK